MMESWKVVWKEPLMVVQLVARKVVREQPLAVKMVYGKVDWWVKLRVHMKDVQWDSMLVDSSGQQKVARSAIE